MEMQKDLEDMFLKICAMYILYRKRKRRRRWKVQPLNSDSVSSGNQRKVFLKMKNMNSEQFFLHVRMPRPVFQLLMGYVGRELWKPKQRIGPEERLIITLHFLAHGVSFQSLAMTYKLGQTTIRNLILETCEVLWRFLSPIYISEPSEHQYEEIARDFRIIWNMPNCVGAIDGKHIEFKSAANFGSQLNKHKKCCSIALIAVCNAKYTFTSVSIARNGSESDGGILKSCPFGEALIANKLPLPKFASLSKESFEPFPHFFVGDTAFPLGINLMRPYPDANLDRRRMIFNYRLSRVHRVIENAFGILTTRWRVLQNKLEFSPQNSEIIVLACIVLHNFVMVNDQARFYCPENYVDWEGSDYTFQNGAWRSEGNNTTSLRSIMSFARRASTEAFQLRDRLADFFINEGAIYFQNAMTSNTSSSI